MTSYYKKNNKKKNFKWLNSYEKKKKWFLYIDKLFIKL